MITTTELRGAERKWDRGSVPTLQDSPIPPKPTGVTSLS